MAAAAPTTAGVYHRAKRVMNRSVRALAWDAFSTRSTIRACVEPEAGRDTRNGQDPFVDDGSGQDLGSGPGGARHGFARESAGIQPPSRSPRRRPGNSLPRPKPQKLAHATSSGFRTVSTPSRRTRAASGRSATVRMDFRLLAAADPGTSPRSCRRS